MLGVRLGVDFFKQLIINTFRWFMLGVGQSSLFLSRSSIQMTYTDIGRHI